jgi:flagellar assembly protein FliH
MLLSSKILRGLDIKGWRTYYPPRLEETPQEALGEPEDDQQGPPASEEIARQMEEVLRQIREEGEEQRRQILAQAAEEARLLKEQAWKEAFEEGRKQGEQEAARLLEEAREVLENAWKERQEILAGAEPEIIQIAVSIAEKLLNYKVETDFNCILALMARALNALPVGRNVLLRVNPMDEKICRENFHLLQEQLKQEIVLELQGDQGIPVGSCEVESEEVEVEILLQKELHILGNKLLEIAAASGRRYTFDDD